MFTLKKIIISKPSTYVLRMFKVVHDLFYTNLVAIQDCMCINLYLKNVRLDSNDFMKTRPPHYLNKAK